VLTYSFGSGAKSSRLIDLLALRKQKEHPSFQSSLLTRSNLNGVYKFGFTLLNLSIGSSILLAILSLPHPTSLQARDIRQSFSHEAERAEYGHKMVGPSSYDRIETPG
jgi:hypothetical protein